MRKSINLEVESYGCWSEDGDAGPEQADALLRSLPHAVQALFRASNALDVCAQVQVGSCNAWQIKDIWNRTVSFAMLSGRNVVVYDHISSRNLAEGLLHGCKILLCVESKAEGAAHVLWRDLREFLGLTHSSRLLMLAWLRQSAEGELRAGITDVRTGRSMDVKLRSLIDACRGTACDALVIDAGYDEAAQWIDSALGHPRMVNGVSFAHFLEWASESSWDDSVLWISTLHSHEVLPAAEPGMNPVLAPICRRKNFGVESPLQRSDQS